MKIRREHELYEFDVRYASGNMLYKRDFSRAGVWTKSSSRIQTSSISGSLQTRKKAHFSKIALRAIRFFKSRSILNFRISLRSESRKVHGRKRHQQLKDSIYLEVTEPRGFSYLTPLADLDFSKVAQLYSEHLKHYSRPLVSKKIQFESLVFNPAVFGYLLHEGLGHRLESDDHSSNLQLQDLPRTNFSVVDGPGNENILGHTPFDDYGVYGSNVVLFDGLTGKTNLLSAQSGNSRAVSHEFHPLVRQRCLMVGIHNPVAAPNLKNSLCLQEVLQGSWDGEYLELDISKAIFTDSRLREYRFAPFTLKMRPEIVSFMHAYGENKISHPAGGCHKNLQRGLDIGFDTPSAYISLNAHKRIESLLEFLF